MVRTILAEVYIRWPDWRLVLVGWASGRSGGEEDGSDEGEEFGGGYVFVYRETAKLIAWQCVVVVKDAVCLYYIVKVVGGSLRRFRAV